MMRVVLVDDAEDVRRAVAALIGKANHEIVGHAADGAAGVRETLAQRPDLVIMDWHMPGMDGVEATRRIKASYPDAAVVAYCSSDTRELRDAFLTAGAAAFVAKWDVTGLIAAVHAIAESRGAPL